jgi:hypothetical protein
MKASVKRIITVSFVVFLLMQLYQPARNIDYGQVSTTHFNQVYRVPKKVETILKISCYDCHSNTTRYPWYAYIQPARMVMDSHIKEGKENLNFSEWGNYSSRKQGNKLDRIIKQIKSDEMPLSSYTFIHKEAILTTAQKAELIHWIEKMKDSISSVN